jgi:hypothetical protein|tara:strand:+ start:236 stop:847 length:612 start_codon:yes stop_codon:yes gene_type:complete
MQVKSYSDLENLIKSLAGVFSFTDEEKNQILNFVNRRAFEAYNISPVWPRYLVISEERTISSDNLIPYTQTSPAKDEIAEFIRIHRKRAFLNNSALEYDFFVDSNGANILNIVSSEATSAFVTYKKILTAFTENSSIPAEFFYFIAHAAYADFLRMDGQHGKALAEEQLAKNYLDIELEKIDIRSNNNSINQKFSTYVNRQSR